MANTTKFTGRELDVLRTGLWALAECLEGRELEYDPGVSVGEAERLAARVDAAAVADQEAVTDQQ